MCEQWGQYRQGQAEPRRAARRRHTSARSCKTKNKISTRDRREAGHPAEYTRVTGKASSRTSSSRADEIPPFGGSVSSTKMSCVKRKNGGAFSSSDFSHKRALQPGHTDFSSEEHQGPLSVPAIQQQCREQPRYLGKRVAFPSICGMPRGREGRLPPRNSLACLFLLVLL